MLGPNRAPQKSLLNIHELLEHVRRLVQAEAPAEVTLLRDYDPSIPEITIDREQIIQAVLNVLRNALQAVGSAGTIILRTRTRRQVTVGGTRHRSEEHTSEPQSLMRIPYAVFCFQKQHTN